MLRKLFGRSPTRKPAESADSLNRAGLAALDDGAIDQAVAAFTRALALAPANPDYLTNLACAHLAAGQGAEAADALDRALRANPDHAAAHCNLGLLLAQSGRHDAAAAHLRRVPRDHPAIRAADINLTNALMYACDWDALATHVEARLAARSHDADWWKSFECFQAAPLGIAPDIARTIADAHARALRAQAGAPLASARRPRAGPLRVGYLSSDFRSHATMDLLLEVLEAHDPAAVDVTLYSWGPDDGSEARRRAVAAHKFVEIGALAHEAAARRVAADAIDIAVDLKGHTGDGRPQILAHRPAPVMVNFLGYPGTLGEGLADWVIADAVTVPPGSEAQFSESVLRLPRTCQANGRAEALPVPMSRAAAGLPADALVLACFNSAHKISRDCFAAWMEILAALPRGVLWLLDGGADANRRLRDAAARAGIDPARLLVAPPLPRDQHLARLAAADLGLDTWPLCAHTLASDACRAGLPLVTVAGNGFAARVASSVLCAAGLDGLVVDSRARYVEIALELGRDPAALADARHRLAAGRAALFDPARFAPELEEAFRQMHSGVPPS
jgi:predicted O-linked N-acetylglucosamine transferase (SPINDLY family)